MFGNEPHVWRIGALALITALSLWLPAQAALTVTTVIGKAQYAAEGQPWGDVTPGMTIPPSGDAQPGAYDLRTSADSEVMLEAGDGTVFYLRESARARLYAVTVTPTHRMYRAELAQGMLNVELPARTAGERVAFTRVVTAIAVLDAAAEPGRPTAFQIAYAPDTRQAEVYNFSGPVSLLQTDQGAITLAGLFGGRAGDEKEGMTFQIAEPEARVDLVVHPEIATIFVKSTHAVTDLVTMIGDAIGMEVTNIDDANQAPITLFMPNGEDAVTLDRQGRKLFVLAAPSGVIQAAAPQHVSGRFTFVRELGELDAVWIEDGGQRSGMTWSEPLLRNDDAGMPTLPPVPDSPPPEVLGSPILPGS